MIALLRGHAFRRTDLVLGLMTDQDPNVGFQGSGISGRHRVRPLKPLLQCLICQFFHAQVLEIWPGVDFACSATVRAN